MNKMIVSLAILVASAGLAGCAPAPLTKADVDGKVVCHPDRMDAVERQARHEGKQLQWINCPQATLRAS